MEFVSDYIGPIGCEGIHYIQTGKWRTRRPVLNAETCIKCGVCLMYCPVNSVLRNADGSFRINYDFCKGCGICAHECKQKAITMVAEKEE